MPKIIENLRDDILNESMKIIDDEGIDGLSIRRLSSKLGIAPSTIYNYYRGKEQIIGALTKRRWDEALLKIDRERLREAPVIDKLAMVVEEMRTSVKPLLVFHISSVKDTGENKDHAYDHQKKVFSQLQNLVEKILSGGDPHSECNHGECAHSEGAHGQGTHYEGEDFMASVITKLLIMCMHDDDMKFEDMVETIKRL